MRSSTARTISSMFAGLRVRLSGSRVPLGDLLARTRYAGVSSTNRSVTSEDCMIAASALAGISVPCGNSMSTRTVSPERLHRGHLADVDAEHAHVVADVETGRVVEHRAQPHRRRPGQVHAEADDDRQPDDDGGHPEHDAPAHLHSVGVVTAQKMLSVIRKSGAKTSIHGPLPVAFAK